MRHIMGNYIQDAEALFTLRRADVVQILYLLDTMTFSCEDALTEDDHRMAQEMYEDLSALVDEQDANC